jgi:hypothetical protein
VLDFLKVATTIAAGRKTRREKNLPGALSRTPEAPGPIRRNAPPRREEPGAIGDGSSLVSASGHFARGEDNNVSASFRKTFASSQLCRCICVVGECAGDSLVTVSSQVDALFNQLFALAGSPNGS